MSDERDEWNSRRRKAAAFLLLIGGKLFGPIAGQVLAHYVAIKVWMQTRAARTINWTRKRVQNVASFLRQHGLALAASFLGVAALSIILATMSGLFDVVPPVPSGPPFPSSFATSSNEPSSTSTSIPSPNSSSPSGSTRPLESNDVTHPSPNSSRSPRPTSTTGSNPTPTPVPTSSSRPTNTPPPASTPPSVEPTPTSTPSATPSHTPRPTPTPRPSQEPTPSPTIAPTPTSTSTASPTATPSTSPRPSIRPHDCRHAPRCHKPPKEGALNASDVGLGLLLGVFVLAVVGKLAVGRWTAIFSDAIGKGR